MRSSNIRYMPAVDHLRAFAALLIVFYHGLHLFSYDVRFHTAFGPEHWLQPDNPLLAVLAEGHTAVGLFMVLSGFILTQAALDTDVVARDFLRNRLLRTYPLFVLMIIAGIAAAPANFSTAALLQTLFGLANLPGALVAPPFTSMLWTIAIEWQFYLMFPLLVRVLRPAPTRNLVGLLVVLIAFRGLAVAAGGNARDLGYLTILGRLDEFLIGMSAAWFMRAHPWSRSRGGIVAVVSGLLILIALYAFNRAGGWPVLAPWKVVWTTIEGGLWATFVLGYVACADAARGAWSRILASIGEISYSIYLIHFVIIYLLVQAGAAAFFTSHWITAGPVAAGLLDTLLIALPLTLALSWLTYRFVERPFLRLRGRYHRDAPAR